MLHAHHQLALCFVLTAARRDREINTQQQQQSTSVHVCTPNDEICYSTLTDIYLTALLLELPPPCARGIIAVGNLLLYYTRAALFLRSNRVRSSAVSRGSLVYPPPRRITEEH